VSKKADHNRRLDNKGRPPWEFPADFNDPDVPAEDLARLKSDFLSAAHRAEQRLKPAGWLTPGYRWQWAAAVGVFLLVAAAGIFLVMRNAPVPGTPTSELLANTVEVDTQVMIVAEDGLAIPNVRLLAVNTTKPVDSVTGAAWLLREPFIGTAHAGIGDDLLSLIGISNAGGWFTIDPFWLNGPIECRLELFGQEIGWWYPANQPTNPFDQFFIPVTAKNFQREKLYDIYLSPGQTKPLGDCLSATLSPDAPGNWQGQLKRDQSWPAYFNYASMLDGIITLVEGEPSEYLTINVEIEPAVYERWLNQSAEPRLIVHSDRYAGDREATPDPDIGIAYCYHHGWYHADNPPAEYLPRTECATLRNADGSLTVSWCPELERKYALLLPPVTEKPPLVAYAIQSSEPGSDHRYCKWLYLGEMTDPAAGLYKLIWIEPSGKRHDLQSQLQGKLSWLNLEEPVTEDVNGKETILQILGPEIPAILPGTIELVKHDFTLQDPAVFEPVEVRFDRPPGRYWISVDKGEIGEYSVFRIEGENTDELRVSWDFFDNQRIDAEGTAVRFLVDQPNWLQVRAIIREPSGVIQTIKKHIDYTSSNVVGFYNGAPTILTREQPGPPTGFLAMTPQMIVSPIRQFSGAFLGPAVLVRHDAGEDKLDLPLAELTITLHGSCIAGEGDQLYLRPHFNLFRDANKRGEALTQNENAIDLLTGNPLTGKELFNDPAYGNVSLDVMKTLAKLDRLDATNQPIPSFYAILEEYAEEPHHWRSLKIALGDIQLTPEIGDKELQLLLQEFKASKYYNVRTLTGQDVSLTWTMDLRGASLPPGGGIAIAIGIETLGFIDGAQWELHSGPDAGACVTITNVNGEKHTEYIDYSLLYEDGEHAPAYLP